MILTAIMALALVVFLVGCLVRPGKMFTAFLVLLSAHVLVMSLAWTLGVKAGALRVFSAWKEMALVAMVVCALARRRDQAGGLLAGRGSFQPLIVILAAFVGLHVFGTVVFGAMNDARAPMLELRVILVMVLAYFAGKVVAADLGVSRILRSVVWVGALAAAWGIVELAVCDEAFWVDLGYPSYLRDFMGQHYHSASGVQENWYTIIAGTPVRRAMSAFMSSQPFAKMLLVAIPAGLMLCAWKRTRLTMAATLAMAVALLLTLTRACILAVAASSTVYFVATKHARKLPVVVTAVLVVVVLFIYSDTVTSFWTDSLGFVDPSSQSHLHVWDATADLVMEKPLLGHGAGTHAGIASRLSATPETLAGEQTYLVFASQYGIVGGLLYIAVMIATLTKAVALHRRGARDDEARMLGGVLFITWGAIVLGALTTYMWGSPYISIVPWMLVGAADRVLATPVRTAEGAGHTIDFSLIRERVA